MRFLHAADIHLDSPLTSLTRYEGAPADAIRLASREALEALVTLAIDEAVDFVVIAGDLYDGEWADVRTGMAFAAQMRRLDAPGIPVYLITGNHDAASVVTQSLRLPGNVHVFPTDHPETVHDERLGVALHGQGYATRAVEHDLAAGYPPPVPGALNIGLLHTAVDGHEDHARYAPCTLDALRAKGYDYWALGHIHEHRVLSQDPWIVFSGCLQGRHARECGRKGAVLVDAEGDAVRIEHRALDVVRWAVCDVDCAGAADEDEVLRRVEASLRAAVQDADGRLLATRLVLRGGCAAHDALVLGQVRVDADLRLRAGELWGDAVWVEDIRFQTCSTVDVEALLASDSPLADVLRAARETALDEAALRALAEELQPLAAKLPDELRRGTDAVEIGDPAALREVLADVERLLPARLAGGS